MEVTIVYYIYLNPLRNWQALLMAQLHDLVSYELTHYKVLMMVASEESSYFTEAEQLAREIIPNIIIHRWNHNQYEYPGLLLVHQVALQSSNPTNHVILYFHSKGMVNSTAGGIRTEHNLKLTQAVIQPWREILPLFIDLTLNKVGYEASTQGFQWFNFWWARASYLQQLEHPKASPDDRWYYEFWLSHLKEGVSSSMDCYSLSFKIRGKPNRELPLL